MQEEFNRFKSVVAARKTANDLVDLIGKLKDSQKFSEDLKPELFEYLLHELMKKIPDSIMGYFMAELAKHNIIEYLLYELDSYDMAKVSEAITHRVMRATAQKTSEGYRASIYSLEKSGIFCNQFESREACEKMKFSSDMLDAIFNESYKCQYDPESIGAWLADEVFA